MTERDGMREVGSIDGGFLDAVEAQVLREQTDRVEMEGDDCRSFVDGHQCEVGAEGHDGLHGADFGGSDGFVTWSAASEDDRAAMSASEDGRSDSREDQP